MATYTLTCTNNSQLHGSFTVFQKPPKITAPAVVHPLAWLARPTAPGSQVTFSWNTNYNFVWAEAGDIASEIYFKASQVIPADPNGLNFVQLTKDSSGATIFSGQNTTGDIGSLTIRQLSNIVSGEIAIGIGMSGSAIYAITSAPNITAVFTPIPNYWIIFGNYEMGDIINPADIDGAVQLTYSGSLTAHTAVLNSDNLITITD